MPFSKGTTKSESPAPSAEHGCVDDQPQGGLIRDVRCKNPSWESALLDNPTELVFTQNVLPTSTLKAFIAALLFLALAPLASGQVYHVLLTGKRAIPPNQSSPLAEGLFQLNGDLLTYEIYSPTSNPLSGSINGPANARGTAPVIFSLESFLASPDQPASFGYRSIGGFILDQYQTDQLKAGLWYVTLALNSSANGAIRAQIIRGPKPATAVVHGHVTAVLGLREWQPLAMARTIASFMLLPGGAVSTFPVRATVIASDSAGRVVTSAQTDSSGNYTLHLPPGVFKIAARSADFRTQHPSATVDLNSYFSRQAVDLVFEE